MEGSQSGIRCFLTVTLDKQLGFFEPCLYGENEESASLFLGLSGLGDLVSVKNVLYTEKS